MLFTNAKLALNGIACDAIAAWFAARSVDASLTGFDARASLSSIATIVEITIATQLRCRSGP